MSSAERSPAPAPPDPMGYNYYNETVSSPVAAELAGVSFRQLDHWSRKRIVHPDNPTSGSGSRRRFYLADVKRLARLSALSKLSGNPTLNVSVMEELADSEQRSVIHQNVKVYLSVDFGQLDDEIRCRWNAHFASGFLPDD